MRLLRLFKRDLAEEVSGWVQQGLISREQGLSICQLYDADLDGRRSRSTGYLLLMVLGYLFIGLSLITLIGANWEQIPRELRLFGMLGLTLGTQAMALKSYLGNPASRGPTAMFLLGNLFYGASIILIAQTYHLGEHMPDGIFWWALGSLPFGVLLRDSWLTLFSLILALVWFFVEFNMGFFPLMMPLFIGAAIYVLLRGRESRLLFLATLGACGIWLEGLLSWFWGDGRYGFDFSEEHFAVTAGLFVLFYALSHWLNLRKESASRDYGVLLSLWTMRFGMLVMFVLSFEEPWRELIRAHWFHATSMWLITALLLLAALALARHSKRIWQVAGLSLYLVGCLLALQYATERESAVIFQISQNILLLCWGVYLIVRGVHSGSSHYFFLGVVAILLTAFIRYVDLIGDYVGASMLFMVFAALMLGAARYWRRQVAKSPEMPSQQENSHDA